MSTTGPGVNALVDALVGAFVSLNRAEQRLVVAAYRLLGQGAAVDTAEIARAARFKTTNGASSEWLA